MSAVAQHRKYSSSVVAPYRRIAAILRGRIESGQYAPGQLLPGIHDLMREYGVAHLTANKALRLLVAEGVRADDPMRKRRGPPRLSSASCLLTWMPWSRSCRSPGTSAWSWMRPARTG